MRQQYFWQWLLLGVSIASACSYGNGETDARPELTDPDEAVAPIVHKPFFRGERELFGYAPRFTPNPISFDADNRPYIRDGADIQTPDASGRWTRRPIMPSIDRYFLQHDRSDKHKILGGQFVDQRVVFDDRDDAYTLVKTETTDGTRLFLLHSQDRCISWDAHPLPPLSHARLEFRDGHNSLAQPPAVLAYQGRELAVVLPKRTDEGSLLLDSALTVSEQSLLVPNHSGGGNSVITVGDRVYIVFPSSRPLADNPGAPQYITALSRSTGEVVTPPTLLGAVGSHGPDPHYLPAIAVDSKGTLHVVLGSHHDSLYYLKSTAPLDAGDWSAPKTIGKRRIPTDGGHSYPALLCDSHDRLHLVTRWAGDGYYFRLAYLKGDAATGRWEPQRVLVQPFRNMYSNWYHHLSLDRHDRLFLNYRYYANQLNNEQTRAYREKWPDDGLPPPGNETAPWHNQIRAHDPAMLFSDDAGASWRLATTDDLLRE